MCGIIPKHSNPFPEYPSRKNQLGEGEIIASIHSSQAGIDKGEGAYLVRRGSLTQQRICLNEATSKKSKGLLSVNLCQH